LAAMRVPVPGMAWSYEYPLTDCFFATIRQPAATAKNLIASARAALHRPSPGVKIVSNLCKKTAPAGAGG
jgi:hypothetical protein